MKKIISLVIAFVISATTVFADGTGDALVKVLTDFSKVTSAEGEYSMSIEVNEPLEVLNTIPLPAEDVDIDLRLVAESVISATTNMSYTYSISDDFKKMSMAATISSDTPIQFSDSFSMSAYAKVGVWIEYDFTDPSKPVYRVVCKLPFYKKYVGMDMSEYFKEHTDEIPVIDSDMMKEIQKKSVEGLISSANVERKGRNFTVTLDDAGAKEYIMSVFNLAQEYALSQVKSEEAADIYEKMTVWMQDFFDKTTIFGEDGLVFEVGMNSKGNVEAESVRAHIKMNVFDILESYEKSTDGLTRENAVIDLTLKADYTFKNHNKVSKAEFPEITDENSNIMENFAGNQYGYTDEYKYFNIEATPVFENDDVYYPIALIAEKCGYDVVREDNKITVNTNNGTVGSVVFDINTNSIIANGEETNPEGVPVIEKNGELYFTMHALGYISVNVYSGSYDIKTNTFSFGGNSYLPEKSQESEEAYTEEYVYVPDTLYYNFHIDRQPELYNGEYYMPVYEFISSLFAGEFTFGEGLITYKATDENIFDISAFSAKSGDLYVTINGEQVALSSPVIEVDGIIQIPVSFTDYLGLSLYFSTNYFTGGACETCFDMNIANPDYDEEDNYVYQPDVYYYYVQSDRAPYINNQMLYIPVYDMLTELYDNEGDFVFGDDWMEFTVPENNKTKIQMTKISVKAGDNFVTVDDKQINLSDPVVQIDDVLRVPVSFVNELGLELGYVNFYSNGGTSFNLKLNNPDYVMSEYEKEMQIFENNWFYKLFE